MNRKPKKGTTYNTYNVIKSSTEKTGKAEKAGEAQGSSSSLSSSLVMGLFLLCMFLATGLFFSVQYFTSVIGRMQSEGTQITDKVKFGALGLENTEEMFKHAISGGFAVPAFNFNNMEQMQAIITACTELNSPVILQISKSARKYINDTLLRYMVQGAVAYSRAISSTGKGVPIALNLDHGDTFELCAACVDSGFSNVMIDGSALPYEDNIALTKRVVEYAHQHGVTVEGELGVLAGIEDEVVGERSHYTQPEQVEDFVKRTGVDSLAISIGTSHGAYKFSEGTKPKLRMDILGEIERRIPGFPIVLHGSSSVPAEYVETINEHGGKLGTGAIGVPEDQIMEAVRSAVCKVNIDSDGRLAMTAAVRKFFDEHPEQFDPRQYLKQARDELVKLYKHKCYVLNSDGKSWY